VSRRPLQVLAFLLPLILVYELGLVLVLPNSGGTVTTNKAHEALLRFFNTFGVTPSGGFYYTGGLAVVIVLLVWHLLVRDRWKIHWAALGLMACESLLLALPLVMLAQVVLRLLAASALITLSNADDALIGLKGVLISVGAGIYEELAFRMLLIAVLHTLMVDVAKASERVGTTVAVLVSAGAFAAYHQISGAGDLVFLFLAGVYFGAIFVVRGFGIVVAVHAIYDIITVLMRSSTGS